MARYKATARPIVPVGTKKSTPVPLPHTPRDKSPRRNSTPSPKQIPTPKTEVKLKSEPVEKKIDEIYFVELLYHREGLRTISQVNFYKTLEDATRKVNSILADPSIGFVDKWVELDNGLYKGAFQDIGSTKPQMLTLHRRLAKVE